MPPVIALRTPLTVTAVVAAAVALRLAAPTPGEALHELRGGDAVAATADPTGPVVAGAALLGWALAAWLAATLVLTLASRLPGPAGAAAAATARRIAPAVVRRAAHVALGLSVVGGVAATTAGTATAAAPAATTASAPAYDWPTGGGAPSLDWPSPTTPQPSTEQISVRAAPVTGRSEAQPVVVRPGDTLWALAESSLADRTGAPPATAEVARAWPQWWAANREAIGADPDLLLPGTSLRPPPDPAR
jgi:hypothetical protein